jgi:hypothetical protein
METYDKNDFKYFLITLIVMLAFWALMVKILV